MIAFIVSDGRLMNTLQTEWSIRDILPDVTVVRLAEVETGKMLNETLAQYTEPFFLTFHAGDTVRLGFQEVLQQWKAGLNYGLAGVIIMPKGISRKHVSPFENKHAAYWRTSAVMADPEGGFRERSHLPFDHYVLTDKQLQLLSNQGWHYAETESYTPSRAAAMPLTQVEPQELLPLLKNFYSHEIHRPHPSKLPLISIVLCTYNNAGYLPWAVRSVIAQSYPAWELMIVDDGSTDGTAAYLNTLQPNPRIRSLIMESNQGKAVCLNEALKHAKGDWLLELDADDWLTADSLLKLAEQAHMNDEKGILYANHYEWEERRNGQLIFRGVKHTPHIITHRSLLEEGMAIAPRMYRTDLLNQAEGWNTSVPWGGRLYEDIELLVRLTASEAWHHIPFPLYNRRIRQNSMTHAYDQRYEEWKAWMLKHHSEMLT
ncbi:glycosyltransferase family 2 protein [Paenibacillus sp. SAF-054]|uniref:glycosyltransferase family 2 protein n=1 Tax=unclassified Paenibacillus TaxID=185978 RepID=UPI003F7E3BF6